MTANTPLPTVPSPTLNIDGYRFAEMHVSALEEGADASPRGVHIDYDVFSHPEDRRRFAVGLKIVHTLESDATADVDAIRLQARVSALGFFTHAENLPESIPLPVAVNGMALLYGIIRGVVSTAASWFDAHSLLPSVNFSQLVRDRVSEDSATEPPAPARAQPRATSRKRQRK